jgi:hypothetical protein
MISFSSFPMFVGSFTAGLVYTGLSICTTAAQTTANVTLTATECIVGFVGGPWLQLPFRAVRGIVQPLTEKTVQTATLAISLTSGAIVGTTAYVGQTLWNREPSQKLKTDIKNEEWVVL